MDDPQLDASEHRLALAGLARLNSLSRSGAGVWRHPRAILPSQAGVSILDVAVGSGDVLVDLWSRAAADGVALELQALDISEEALQATRERAESNGTKVVTYKRDVVREGIGLPDHSVDIVVCTLFLHHLSETEVTALLREMARVARRGIVVCDLLRCRRGLIAATLASRVLSRSHVVRTDAVRSVQGAFTLNELASMASAAGLSDSTVTPTRPFRMTLTWKRP